MQNTVYKKGARRDGGKWKMEKEKRQGQRWRVKEKKGGSFGWAWGGGYFHGTHISDKLESSGEGVKKKGVHGKLGKLEEKSLEIGEKHDNVSSWGDIEDGRIVGETSETKKTEGVGV